MPAPSTRDPARHARRPRPACRRPAVKGAATPLGAEPFLYFVQAGAYARTEDAEQQRAKLAIRGFEARSANASSPAGPCTVCGSGPFDRKEDADAAKDKLTGAGIEAALVRVQK